MDFPEESTSDEASVGRTPATSGASRTPGSRDPGAEAMLRRISTSLFGEETLPVRIGRFRVLEAVGSGGMGVVYAAHDDELDRTVAIKVIRGQDLDDDETERLRLIREARALARLSHPNVVHVYEAGSYDKGLFIVMEFVPGFTVRRWLRDESRAWRDILDCFIAAGRGLAAAHAAGIVHRDFKPANVLVGDDDRVRVVDFGLARGSGARDEPMPIRAASTLESGRSASSSQLKTRLTGTGARLGTPAYMSPEQIHGMAIGPASDQFSFCVALFEALFGERPYAHESLLSMRDFPRAPRTISASESDDRDVPKWLRVTLRRGLELSPEDRYPSMDALLDLLANTPTRIRRRRYVTGALAAGVAVAAGSAAIATSMGATCPDPHLELDGIWDDETRAASRNTFLATNLSYAENAWILASREVDAYAEDWVATRARACEAARARGAAFTDNEDRAAACLFRRRQALATLSAMMRTADKHQVQSAHKLAGALPSIALCEDPTYLAEGVELPETQEELERYQANREHLDRAVLLRSAGKLEEALEIGSSVLKVAEELGFESLEAEALYLVARCEGNLERGPEARDHLQRGLLLADKLGLDALRWGMWDDLAVVQSIVLEDNTQARASVRFALSALERAGMTPRDRARVLRTSAIVATSERQLADAESSAREALRLYTSAHGEKSPQVADVLLVLANILAEQERRDEALETYQRALGFNVLLFGTEHPHVARVHFNLGLLQIDRGEYDQARGALERSLELERASFGDDHVRTGSIRLALAQVHLMTGQFEDAIPHGERALEIMTRGNSPEYSDRIMSAMLLSMAYEASARPRDARRMYELLFKVEKHLDAKQLLELRLAAAHNLCDLDRCAEASPLIERAAAGGDPPVSATYDIARGRGRIAIAEERHADAVTQLREALRHAPALREEELIDDDAIATLHLQLALALERTGAPRAERREHVTFATAHYDTTPGSERELELLRRLGE